MIVAMQAYVSVVESEQRKEGRKEKSSKKQKEEVDPVLQYPTSIVHAYLAIDRPTHVSSITLYLLPLTHLYL